MGSQYLPEDIWMNVLYMLSVESLVRCRCVCKAWHQIISDTSFVTAHLAHQKTSSNNKYILYDGYIFCSLLADFESIFDGTYRNSRIEYPGELFKRGDTYETPKIYGICDGLLCLSNEFYLTGDNIYLFNLACRKIKKLPEITDFTKDDAGSNFIRTVPGVSFGYYDDDYKVIVIAPVGYTFIVYVYGLNNDSWKSIHTSNCYAEKSEHVLPCIIITDTKFVLNTVYALTSARLICFDLRDETIRLVEFPIKLDGQLETMEAYGETLVVLVYQDNHPRSINMWILRDHKLSCWENKFSIELQKGCRDAELVGILDNGQYLVRTRNDAGDLNLARTRKNAKHLITYFLCDLDCLTLTKFRSIYANREQLNPGGLVYSNYVESLLLLNEDSLDSYLALHKFVRQKKFKSKLVAEILNRVEPFRVEVTNRVKLVRK